MSAFQQDLHLVIRPDDIWLAILTQFNFYVNASTKMLPQPFATFMGKKQLYQMSSLITCDDLFGHVDSIQGLMEYFPRGQAAQMLIENLEQIVEDPGLREWMLPNFSTTTLDDKAIASTVMMSTFQKHVEYSACGPRAFCGFPVSHIFRPFTSDFRNCSNVILSVTEARCHSLSPSWASPKTGSLF